MMHTGRDQLEDLRLSKDTSHPDTIIFCVGSEKHEDFSIPYDIALQTPYLAEQIPRPYCGAPIHLPDINAEDFRRYTKFLLFTLPLAKFLIRDPTRPSPPRGHPLEHQLTWSECLPLIKSYVFADYVGDDAFRCYIGFELEQWLCVRQKQDLTKLEYVVTAEGVSQELKTWVVSRMFQTAEDVPNLLKRFWGEGQCDQEPEPEWEDGTLGGDSDGAQRRKASGAVSTRAPRQHNSTGGRLKVPEKVAHGEAHLRRDAEARTRPIAEMSSHRSRNLTYAGATASAPSTYRSPDADPEARDAITALPRFPYSRARPLTKRYEESISRSTLDDAAVNLGEVWNKQPEVQQDHTVYSQAASITEGRKAKAPLGRRKRFSKQFFKGFVEVRGAPGARAHRRGTQLWTPLV